MKFLLIALACLTAQAFAAPSSKALEDDVAAANTQTIDFNVEVLIFANRIQVLDQTVDLTVRPLSNNIMEQLGNLNISAANVTDIEMQFDTSFSAIQTGIRGVEQVIRETSKTLERILEDLDDSNWNNLRAQDRRLRDELAVVDSRYAQAKEEIDTSNAALEISLVNVLDGQATDVVVEVLSNWQQIKDIFNSEVTQVDDVKIVYDARGVMTLNAIDVVLDQVV